VTDNRSIHPNFAPTEAASYIETRSLAPYTVSEHFATTLRI
jgi:hypothetical protein